MCWYVCICSFVGWFVKRGRGMRSEEERRGKILEKKKCSKTFLCLVLSLRLCLSLSLRVVVCACDETKFARSQKINSPAILFWLLPVQSIDAGSRYRPRSTAVIGRPLLHISPFLFLSHLCLIPLHRIHPLAPCCFLSANNAHTYNFVIRGIGR